MRGALLLDLGHTRGIDRLRPVGNLGVHAFRDAIERTLSLGAEPGTSGEREQNQEGDFHAPQPTEDTP